MWNNLHTALKTYTKDEHARLEHRLVGRIRRVKDKEGDRDLLGLFYGFYTPVEDSLGVSFATESLLRDIAALEGGACAGGGVAGPVYTAWPAPRHPLGARYV